MHILSKMLLAILTCESDYCMQTLLLATFTAYDDDVGEDCSVSGFKCRALIKRATSYTIFKPPHKKQLQRHMLFAAK